MESRVFPFFGAISAKVSGFLAPEAQSLFHQLGSLLFCHHFVHLGDHINIHGAVVFLFVEIPPGLQFFFLQPVSPENPLDFMIVVVCLEGLLIPFRESFGYVISVQNLLEEGNPNRFLKVIEGGGGVFRYSQVGQENLELCYVVFDRGCPLSQFNDFVKCIPLEIIGFEAIPELLEKILPRTKAVFSISGD